jgi:hypothetical protein
MTYSRALAPSSCSNSYGAAASHLAELVRGSEGVRPLARDFS